MRAGWQFAANVERRGRFDWLIDSCAHLAGQQGAAASGRMQEVHSYFKDRWEAKDRAAADGQRREGASHSQQAGSDGDDDGDEAQLVWDADHWQQAEGLRARTHAAAVLANAAAEVSAPLVTASQLQVPPSAGCHCWSMCLTCQWLVDCINAGMVLRMGAA